ESLQRQTSYNFEWLIVDDGSTDNTAELIHRWQTEETRFQIRYIYKENGGLHTGYNKGIELAETELFVCIDSDDWMPDDAIERIEKLWSKVSDKGYVGIMGIDHYENGECVGGMFPDDTDEMYLHEKLTKYQIPGDKKMIHRTDLLKKVAPMPTFEREKNFNPSYLMYQLDQFGKLYVTNECFCIVEYQPDGMSSNIFRQYRNSPRSFAETRRLYLSFPDTSWKFKLKHSIHYMSSCILAGRLRKGFAESPYPAYSLIGLLPGLMLSILVLYKSR
ncbi:MAG: glycosyltransferase, partial [Clostridia bacterium]|nr:glycosyltransferase [Clostridia bacterium]